jgi:hypothetical protein
MPVSSHTKKWRQLVTSTALLEGVHLVLGGSGKSTVCVTTGVEEVQEQLHSGVSNMGQFLGVVGGGVEQPAVSFGSHFFVSALNSSRPPHALVIPVMAPRAQS